MHHASPTRFWPAVACLLLVACGGGSDSSGNPPPPGSGGKPPPANSPPSISGTPSGSATVGQAWNFRPAILDPDGDALTVTVANLPPWVSLEPATGYMEGTPGEGDIRTWGNILVRVSDGQATTSLAWFSIVVSAGAAHAGTATVSWSPPTQRADGSPIGQLAGYRVLYGQTSQNWNTVVQLNNPGLTRYVVEGLGPGRWYFVVKAVTADGLISAPSQEVSKAI
jgi:hypothetical protein